MARRTLGVVDVIGILQHWHLGRSLREMSASREEWAELVPGWFPELADARLRQVTWPATGEHHEFIAIQLQAGVRVPAIWQRLRHEHGLAVSVASLRRYVLANVPEGSGRTQVRMREQAADSGQGAD